MDQLEDSTLDLIHRRRVRSFIPGYVVVCAVVFMLAALPLVRVDVVTTTAGMIRPLEEPVKILSPITGILDSSILRNNLPVTAGDTLVWIRRDHPETRITEHLDLIRMNDAPLRDIRRILDGKEPVETGWYIQSYRNHLAALAGLQIEEDFLRGEYQIATELYRAGVIPPHELEQAESEYRLICARIRDLRENYRNQLAGELHRIARENRNYQKEIAVTRSMLHDYFIVAPKGGTVHGCPGLTAGSVIQSGMHLGSVSPSGSLVAECYLDPAGIQGVTIGTPVRLRFDGSGFQEQAQLETAVDHIERDVTLVNGKPFYRIRCTLESPCFIETDGKRRQVVKGMTFSANFILFRRSLSSLIMERMNGRINPAGPMGKE
ncbi:MAG TPA: HlyD family efflux transporter periplasmic adaptor subunit [Bacteroides sp.]|nr:HlyD family efflux transporter periplasmic adaptor subunit [Bacteroides sp.]